MVTKNVKLIVYNNLDHKQSSSVIQMHHKQIEMRHLSEENLALNAGKF